LAGSSRRVQVRLIGDKETTREVAAILQEALEREFMLTFREYPFYEDRESLGRRRRVIVPGKTRIYINILKKRAGWENER